MKVLNNYFDLPKVKDGEEVVFKVFENDEIIVEKILSNNFKSKDFMHDNKEELVTLIRGSATLSFENGEQLQLVEGDCFMIKPNLLHKIDCTSSDALWHCVYFKKSTN